MDGSTVHRTALVFTRPDGSPVNRDSLRKPFYRARDAVGPASSVSFHVLRHTYACLLIAAGTHLTAIQERMGHTSIKITSDTYGHLYPAEDDRSRKAIDDALAVPDDPARRDLRPVPRGPDRPRLKSGPLFEEGWTDGGADEGSEVERLVRL